MTDLPEAFLGRIHDEVSKMLSAYRGKIKTVDLTTGIATVTIAAGDVTSQRWLASYAPVVNDMVMLIRLDAEWVMLGKVAEHGDAELPALLTSGTVTAINAGAFTLTATIDGVSRTGMRWLASYGPVVGDLITAERIGGQWLVLGKLGTNLAAVTPPPTGGTVLTGTVAVSPSSVAVADNFTKPGAGWAWGSTGPARQGHHDHQEYGYWDGTKDVYVDYSDSYGALASATIPTLPAGATITSAKLSLSRNTADGGGGLVSPVLYGHTLNVTPSGAITPYLHASYGPWSPGTLAQGQTGTWDLPSGWIAAFMAGTLKGFGIWSNTVAAYSSFNPASFCQLTITYTYTP